MITEEKELFFDPETTPNKPTPNPIKHLLIGESLAAANEPELALQSLADGLEATRVTWENGDIDADFVGILAIGASLHYTMAEVMRVQAAKSVHRKGVCSEYGKWYDATYAKYDSLRDFATDTAITLIAPHQPIDEDAMLTNVFTYLTTRSQGMFELQHAMTLDSGEACSRALVRARDRLYIADEALANGVWHDVEHKKPPPLPKKPTNRQAAEYKFQIALQRYNLRIQRRATDPDLALGLATTTAMLDRRGSLQPRRRQKLGLPSFTDYGPMPSNILAVS